jgi:hypothetical protein
LAWPYATWAATTLFAVGGCAGALIAWRMGVRSPLAFIFAISDPAAAAILLMGLAVAAPDLYIPDRISLLHVFAFPTLYTLGILIFRFFIAASPIGLVMAMSEIPRLDRMWSNLTFLSALWAAQVIILFIYFLIAKRRGPDKIADEGGEG